MTTYMKIDGITGDVTAKGHENWIALQSMNFNVKRTLSATPGRLADREGTRPSISEITITKRMDKTSPHLFIESCTGKSKNVQIDICQSNNNELTPYASFTLRNAIISGYDVNTDTKNIENGKTSSEHHYPGETITLSFDQIEMKYTPFDEQNNPQSPIPAGYDLKQATEMQ